MEVEVATGHAGLIPSTRAPFIGLSFNRDSAAVDGNRENSKIVDSPRFKLVPVRSGFAYLLCEPFSSNRSQFESALGSAEVMIFDNLVVDNKRWHLSNSMLFGRSDSLRGQVERTAVNELLDYTTLKSVELLGLPI